MDPNPSKILIMVPFYLLHRQLLLSFVSLPVVPELYHSFFLVLGLKTREHRPKRQANCDQIRSRLSKLTKSTPCHVNYAKRKKEINHSFFWASEESTPFVPRCSPGIYVRKFNWCIPYYLSPPSPTMLMNSSAVVTCRQCGYSPRGNRSSETKPQK
jgi:hypothetical protein